MIVATTSGNYTATINTGQAGLVGTITLQVSDIDGNVITSPSTANILELLDDNGDPTGEYVAARVAPAPLGSYVVLWSTDGTFDPETVADEDMTVVAGTVTPVLPPIPTPPGPGPVEGPCQSWITSQDVADCCSVDVGSDVAVFDSAAVAASMLLFELSGRKYPGTCSIKVRPCGTPCAGWSMVGWPSQAWYWGLNGGGGFGGWGWWGSDGGQALCGCRALSRVKLAGYPIVAVDEVKIDGVVLPEVDGDGDPNWRLDDWTFLTRLDKPGDPATVRFWPSCQNLALDDDQPGTFAVTYRYGVAPPLPGTLAAAQLACEVYKACDNDITCKLPAGATKVVRQGIEISRSLFLNWGLESHARGGVNPGTWSTGLTLVDVFLNTYARYGGVRRSAFWGPDTQPYARKVGTG